MKKWKAIAGVVLVFILGAAAGAIVSHCICHRRVESLISGGPSARRELIVRRMSRELGLDEGQKARLAAIMKETHEEVHAVRRQLQPQVDAVMARGEDKVRAMLRPEQRGKFEKLLAEWKAKSRMREPEEGPPPHP